jgi:hypothetical protein
MYSPGPSLSCTVPVIRIHSPPVLLWFPVFVLSAARRNARCEPCPVKGHVPFSPGENQRHFFMLIWYQAMWSECGANVERQPCNRTPDRTSRTLTERWWEGDSNAVFARLFDVETSNWPDNACERARVG